MSRLWRPAMRAASAALYCACPRASGWPSSPTTSMTSPRRKSPTTLRSPPGSSDAPRSNAARARVDLQHAGDRRMPQPLRALIRLPCAATSVPCSTSPRQRGHGTGIAPTEQRAVGMPAAAAWPPLPVGAHAAGPVRRRPGHRQHRGVTASMRGWAASGILRRMAAVQAGDVGGDQQQVGLDQRATAAARLSLSLSPSLSSSTATVSFRSPPAAARAAAVPAARCAH